MNYVEEEVTSEEEESEYEYDVPRVYSVNKVGPLAEPTYVRITPTEDAKYWAKIPWTTESRVRKTLLAEKHYWAIRKKNPDIKLRHMKIRFRPFSSDSNVPLLGCMEVRLTNNRGKAITTTVYVTQGQRESLPGKEDARSLGILKIDPDGDYPDEQ